MTGLTPRRVAPFGHPEITACVQLPQAYRSLPRPSSPLDAKASTVCLIAFDLKSVVLHLIHSVLIPNDMLRSSSRSAAASHPFHRLSKSYVKRTRIERVRATPENFRRTGQGRRPTRCSRKEVIQPQVPLRLPCYDFAPVTELTFGGCLLAVSPPTSGPPSFHGVTGGVYKARERIHRGVADPRLLAIPASCSRVADYNPNLDRLLAISAPSRVGDALYRPL
jgi:hypothetical protein